MSEVFKFGTEIDLSGLEKGLSDAQAKISALEGKMSAGVDQIGEAVKASNQEIKDMLKQTSNEGDKTDSVLGKIGKSIAGIGVAFAAQELVSKIVAVRGEFQQLEISFRTMLGSEEKANQLMGQLTETAARTPFDLKSVADGARQLLAYGDSAENINEDLIRLGNIASGLSQPLGDIVYLYGTTMTQGRLYTQDLNQFMGRGIPMMRELASIFGVAESEVKGLVEAGKVGFPEVQKVIQNLTNEGGMFYNLMQEQSKSIPGQISNIQDSIDSMFNEIGRNSEGLISGALNVVSSLVENYERVGRTLLSLVGTYGVYKVAVMTATAIENARKAGLFALTLAEHGHRIALLATEKAQKLLNATMMKNPYVLVATAIAGVVTALIAMESETERAKRIADEYNDTKQATIDKEQEHRSEMEKLLSVAGNEVVSTDKRREALNKLREAYPEIFAKYKTEIEQLEHIRDIKQEIANLDAQRSITNPKVELDTINQRIAELDAKKIKHYKIFGDAILSSDEETEYSQLYKRKRKLETQIAKNEVKGFYSDLSTATDNELKVFQSKMANALAAMQMQGKKYFTFSDGLSKGLTFSKEEIGAFADQIKNEINRRGTEKFTPSEYIAQAKKAVDVARKELNDYINNSKDKVDEMTFNKEVERLKQNLKDAEDRYKKISASSGGSGKTDKQTDIVKEQQKLEDELTKLKQANEDERIALLAEGHDKELEIIENAYEKQKSVIAKQAEEWKSANVKAKVQTEENGLTAEQNKAINQANSLNDSKRDEAIKKANEENLNATLKDILTYEQTRLKIVEEYAEKRKALYKKDDKGNPLKDANGNAVLRDGVEQGNVDELNRQEQEALNAVQKTFSDRAVTELKLSIDWEKAFGDLDAVATSSLKNLKSKLQEYIKTQKDLDPENLKTLQEAIERIDEKLTARNPFEALGVSFNNLKDANNSVKKAQEDYNKALKEGTALEKEQAKVTLDAAKNAKQKALADANKSIQATCNNLQEYISLATALSDMLGAFGVEMPEELTGFISGLSNAIAGLESMDLTRPFSIITGAVKTVTGIFQGIGSLFGFGNGDKKKEKRIENLQQQIEDIEKAYDRLGKKIDGVYGKDASALLEQQNSMLQTQKTLIQNQINEELAKKHTDDERVREWREQIEEIDELIAENRKKAEDAIFGEDIQAAIENFADAYADAWANGTDSATSTRDVVKRMMQSMVKESINAAIQSSNAMQKIRDKLKEFFADNVLSEWEQNYVYNMAEKLQEDLDKQFGWAQSLFEEDQERQAEKKGIATASQESVDELNGRMTAIQGHTFSINETTKLLLSTTQSILQSVMNIESETDGFGMRLERMESSVKGMAATLDEIATRGIRIKN